MIGLYIVITIVIFGVVVIGIVAYATRNTNTKADKNLKARYMAAMDTMEEIFEEADKYDDIEHVLASNIKDMIRNHRKTQRKLDKQ